MKRASLLTLSILGALSAFSSAWAVDYPLPPANSRLIGHNQTYTVQEGDKNLQAIARLFSKPTIRSRRFLVRVPW